MTPNKRMPRVAVVIGSGSVKCAASLGMMRILEREGIPVDLVVGCSGGSLYAAAIAMGWTAEETTAATLKLWTRAVTRKRNYRVLLQLIMPKFFKFDERFGLVDDRLIKARIAQAYGDQQIEQTKIELFITASDLYTGEQVVISEGSLQDAIRGSISIPYIFAPHKFGERYLIDGYLTDPLPVGVAIKGGADLIFAMGFESPNQREISSLMRYNFQLSTITSNNLLRSNYAFHNLAHHAEIVPIIPEFADHVRLFDTDKIPAVIEAGAEAMEKQLPYILKLLNQPAQESHS